LHTQLLLQLTQEFFNTLHDYLLQHEDSRNVTPILKELLSFIT
jgi:hypothetical protein